MEEGREGGKAEGGREQGGLKSKEADRLGSHLGEAGDRGHRRYGVREQRTARS